MAHHDYRRADCVCESVFILLPLTRIVVYAPNMVAVKAENGQVQLTFPTDGMSPQEVHDFVAWLRVESIARRSRLTSEAAWQLAEDIKAGWWEANKARFGEEGAD
jgi:hypothetical protein